MMPRLDLIRECLEGTIPAMVATCASDGTPNIAYLSQSEFIDERHIALSYQFFNTTRRNVLENPQARIIVTHPLSGERFRLLIKYLRTETAGALFERMRAKLAGIASHTGMSGVFRLLGSDVYEVLDIERIPGAVAAPPPPPRNLLASLRVSAEQLATCADLDSVLNLTLACLETHFDIHHTMVLMLDGSGTRLYTVASRGYPSSGIGSEIALGQGVIGVAARENTPIRIGHMTLDTAYARAIRAATLESGSSDGLETEIPLPGLPESRSQLAVPIRSCGRLLGVLYVESAQDLRFGYDDEDALVTLASQFGTLALQLSDANDATAATEATLPAPAHKFPADGPPATIRHYPGNDSIFIDDDYLIKGVAGSILWTLLTDFVARGRRSFSNRELRVDPRIRLPDVSDNLEARLILLRRRLIDRDACVQLDKAGRGHLQLTVRRPLQLVDVIDDLPHARPPHTTATAVGRS